KQIGFIGLGNMGFPMVENLLEAGYSLTDYALHKDIVDKAQNLNAHSLDSPNQLLNKVDLSFESLPSQQVVEEIYLGDKRLSNQKAETIMIDTSTVSQKLNNTLESKALENNLKYLAAPVSGGVVGSINRTLTFMIGGKETVYDEVEDVLHHLGENIFHVGEKIDSGTT